jgi:hypothetical protein
MPLNDLQRAFLKDILVAKDRIIDPATGAPLDWNALGGAASAAGVSFSPTGNVAATDVQAAIAELDSEKQPLDSDLTAIAALSTTAFGRGLLALANAAALAANHTHASSGLNLSYLGTTAVGATVDTPGSNGYGAAKKITVPSDGIIHAIGVYVTQQSGADSFGPAVAIMADNADAPGKVIAYGASQRIDADTQGGRFIDVPCIAKVSSGVALWIAARIADTGGSVLAQLAYDAGGTDRIATWTPGVWAENTTYTTTTRNYSIRALFQS